MGKKQDSSQIYKWWAVSLTLLVVGYIVFLFSQQTFLDKKLTALTRQIPLPVENPSPRPSPIFTVPKGMETWEKYSSKYDRFTILYPKNMEMKEVSMNMVSFNNEEIPGGKRVTFSVRKIGDDMFLDIMPKRSDDKELAHTLFFSPTGVIKNLSISPTTKFTVTKKAEVTLSGYPAVYFMKAYVSQTGQDPSNYSNSYLVDVNKQYYILTENTVDSLYLLNLNEKTFKLFASSLTLY